MCKSQYVKIYSGVTIITHFYIYPSPNVSDDHEYLGDFDEDDHLSATLTDK